MKISKFYNQSASEDWFDKRYGEPSVHESLKERGFRIVDRQRLQSDHSEQEMPTEQAVFSWGGNFPCPPSNFKNTFLPKELFELRNSTFKTQKLSVLISNWMRKVPTQEQYLISLNQDNFLVTTADNIDFEDVFVVSRSWNLDSWIGVFDKSCTMSFIFDLEFDVVIASFAPSSVPDGYEEFSRFYNDEFREVFVRDAKFRTGADPSRAQEYMDKIQHLIS